MRDAGIIDEDVQAAEGRQCLGYQAIGKGGIGDVARNESGSQFVRERRTGGLIAARQHQLRARRRDLPRDGATDARCRTGHQRNFSFQIPHSRSQDTLRAVQHVSAETRI